MTGQRGIPTGEFPFPLTEGQRQRFGWDQPCPRCGHFSLQEPDYTGIMLCASCGYQIPIRSHEQAREAERNVGRKMVRWRSGQVRQVA